MKLAREFGLVCWRSLLASVSAETVIEWREHFGEHGFTSDMDNWRTALICSSNWNVTAMSAGIKLDEPITVAQFLPSDRILEVEPDDDVLMAMGESAGGMRFECSNS